MQLTCNEIEEIITRLDNKFSVEIQASYNNPSKREYSNIDEVNGDMQLDVDFIKFHVNSLADKELGQFTFKAEYGIPGYERLLDDMQACAKDLIKQYAAIDYVRKQNTGI